MTPVGVEEGNVKGALAVSGVTIGREKCGAPHCMQRLCRFFRRPALYQHAVGTLKIKKQPGKKNQPPIKQQQKIKRSSLLRY